MVYNENKKREIFVGHGGFKKKKNQFAVSLELTNTSV